MFLRISSSDTLKKVNEPDMMDATVGALFEIGKEKAFVSLQKLKEMLRWQIC